MMKTLKKNTLGLLLLLFAVFIPPGCGEDYEVPWGICNFSVDYTIDKEIGRVYYYSLDPENQFYYIGDSDTTKRWGGYVPCDGLPDTYIPEGEIGILVMYSGQLRSGPIEFDENTDELIYQGIGLTFIEKADED